MSTSSSDQFQRLEDLFHAFVDLPADERRARLAELREENEELAAELGDLLAAEQTVSTERRVRDAVAGAAASLLDGDLAGRMLGSWRVIRTIGAGGMGRVYLAERADGAFEAQAAIKLVRGAVPRPALQQRLRQERQILAGLAHPGIARLLDGGASEDGTPFLVMEYIEGIPLGRWCDDRNADVGTRLRLLIKICDAVSYAHRRLIVHRDIKPGNILVTGDGEPKLLDFGIATLSDVLQEDETAADSTDSAPAGTAFHTQTISNRMLTPSHASPEQLRGEVVSVQTDIYSLGVLMFELLTGRLPHEVDGVTPIEAATQITTGAPPLPSDVVPVKLRRRLMGDLDAIARKALEKQPEHRYPSVEAMANDLRRHLDGLPISVLEGAWRYRSVKFLRRNAGLFGAGVLIVGLVLTFAVSSFWQARIVTQERDRAEAERATAQRATDFLTELFTQADPNERPTADATARELLDRGAERIFADMESEPAVQAALATVMGRVYRGLGEYDDAAPLLDAATRLRREGVGTAAGLAETLLERGALAYDVGDYEEALALHSEALSFADDDPGLQAQLLDWRSVSLAALGRLEEAEAASRDHLARVRELYDAPNEEIARALIDLADTLRDRGNIAESLTLAQEGLRQRRALYAGPNLMVAHALNHVGSSLIKSGRVEEALEYIDEGLAMRRAIFSEPHVETAASLGMLARANAALVRYDAAIAARRESLDILQEIFGDSHPYVSAVTYGLGVLLYDAERFDEARETLREALRLHRDQLAPGQTDIARPLAALARVYIAQNRPQDAEPLLREAYDTQRQALGPGDPAVADSALALGRALIQLSRPEDAVPLLAESVANLEAQFGAADPRSREAREALAAAHYATRNSP